MHRIFAMVIIVLFLAEACGSAAYEERSSIGKDKILELLKAGETIKDAVFQGEDLVSAVLAARRSGIEPEIHVENSHIKGTLALWKLGTMHVVSSGEAERWGVSTNQKILIIRNSIVIQNCVLEYVDGFPRPLIEEVMNQQREVEEGEREETNRDVPCTVFEGDVSFSGSEFVGIDFSYVIFSRVADFSHSVSKWSANFTYTKFYGLQSFFCDATFRSARFSQASFAGLIVDFSSSSFTKEAAFDDVVFKWKVKFENAEFTGDVVFTQASLGGKADFSGAEFSGYAGFREAKFGRAVFQGTQFKGWIADFETAHFYGVDFSGSIFAGIADFDKAIFEQGANFRDAKFDKELHFDKARFGNLANASLAFSLATRAWERLGDKEEADHYFYLHMVAERRQKSWYDPRRWLELLFVDVTCAYGTSWQRIIITWSVVILVSTLIFWQGNGIVRCVDGQVTKSFWQSLYFSIMTFVSLGTSEYRPRLIHRRKTISRFRSNRKAHDPRRCFDFIAYMVKSAWEYIGRIE